MNVFFLGMGIDPQSGGIERYCYQQLTFLSNAQVHIYCYLLRAQPLPQLAGLIDVNKLLPRWKYVDRFLRPLRLQRYLRDKNISFILCAHIHLLPTASTLASQLKCPLLLMVYGIDCWGGKFQQFRRWFVPLTAVVSISKFTTEQIKLQGYPEHKIHYLPPLIDIPSIESPLRQHHQTPSSFIMLTVGRLSPEEQYKGHDVVIKSLSLIREKVPHVEYWIVGRGGDQSRLQKLAQNLGVEMIVKFWGFVSEEELHFIYAQSDVFVMPSRVKVTLDHSEGEGFGIVFLEASLHRLPLLGPNCGGPVDIIDEGYNGFLIDPHSSTQLAQKIMILAQNPQLMQQMGENAYQKTVEKFSTHLLPSYWQPIFSALAVEKKSFS